MTDHLHQAYRDAQALILSAAFHGCPEVFDTVPVDGLDEDLRPIARVIRSLTIPGQALTLEKLAAGCRKAGIQDPRLHLWLRWPIPGGDAITTHAAAYGPIVVAQAVLRATQDLDQRVDPWDVHRTLLDTLGTVGPVTDGTVAWATYPEIRAFLAPEEPWVIPGLLAHGERMVLTGKEGYGKSLLLYQIALGAAFGRHPLPVPAQTSPDHWKFPGRRVLVLDVENWHETQVRWMVRMVGDRYGVEGDPDFALLRMRHIDLLSPPQRARFLAAVSTYRPDLLVMGSGYKLADADGDWRRMAAAIQRTADQARADTSCAVILETHSGHGMGNDRNEWRPDGSSHWLRWPEFGFGMKPRKDQERGDDDFAVEMVRWRGDRVTGRPWPTGIKKGSHNQLPWVTFDPGDYVPGH